MNAKDRARFEEVASGDEFMEALLFIEDQHVGVIEKMRLQIMLAAHKYVRQTQINLLELSYIEFIEKMIGGTDEDRSTPSE